MAKKRGGIAGIYDRNKGLIRTGATIGATLLGGPMAGAATGAAFRGLDREGKSGIGFDVGQGLKGGLEGYAIGQGTQGVQNLLTGAGKVAAPSLGATKMVSPGVAGSALSTTAPAVGNAASTVENGSKIAALLKGARENKDLIAMAGKGLMSAMPDPANDAALMNAETAQKRLTFEMNTTEEERKRDEARRRAIAEYFMPYVQQMQKQGFNYGSTYADAMRRNG